MFLGDLIDDGPDGLEVVLRVFELVKEAPARVWLLAGNHDEALRFDDSRRLFTSSVLPAEFADQLNAPGCGELERAVGQAFVQLVEQVPRALLFPDGLLAAHGGVPLSDTWEELKRGGLESFEREPVIRDFVWTRAHPRARTRIPDRQTKGAEFGSEDFAGFCRAATAALEQAGRKVERMVRGHDHVAERYDAYERYTKNRILTINTLSHRLPREIFGDYERTPCVARWVPGKLPEVHRLAIPGDVIRATYPEPMESASA